MPANPRYGLDRRACAQKISPGTAVLEADEYDIRRPRCVRRLQAAGLPRANRERVLLRRRAT